MVISLGHSHHLPRSSWKFKRLKVTDSQSNNLYFFNYPWQLLLRLTQQPLILSPRETRLWKAENYSLQVHANPPIHIYCVKQWEGGNNKVRICIHIYWIKLWEWGNNKVKCRIPRPLCFMRRRVLGQWSHYHSLVVSQNKVTI